MAVVNGFYCRNCTEIDLAKKGVNPSAPHPELAPANVTAKREPLLPRQAVEATAEVRLGANRPISNGELGRRLDLYA